MRIRRVDQSQTRQVLRFEVEDTGCGMEKESLGKLFQSFSQTETAFKSSVPGSGLGLSIVKNLAQQMHGEVGIESEVGVGTRVWFMVSLLFAVVEPKPPEDMQKVLKADSQAVMTTQPDTDIKRI